MIRAHGFRFARPAWTRNLPAAGGDLVARRPGVARSPRVPGTEIAVRILELTAALGDGIAVGVEARDNEGSLPPLTLGEAIAAGQVRMIAGNRLDREDLSGGSVRVIGPEERTGDVVFCTSPRPAALVDLEGGSVVVTPARILRINATPGLLPEVLASDINTLPAEAREWKGSRIRQVPPTERVTLTNALAAIEQQRADALKRAALIRVRRELDSTDVSVAENVGAVEFTTQPSS